MKELLEALRPFAEAWDAAQTYKDDNSDYRSVFLANAMTVSDFAAAAEAYKSANTCSES